MRTILQFALLSWSLSSFADLNSFESVQLVAKSYYELGIDNNYLDTQTMSSEEFNKYPSHLLIEPKNIIDAIKECVFFQKGSYGEHIDLELQDLIASNLSRVVNRFVKNGSLYKLPSNAIDISTGNFGAPCVLAIENTQQTQVLLMQGAAID